jgi:hypothetical protein
MTKLGLAADAVGTRIAASIARPTNNIETRKNFNIEKLPEWFRTITILA